MGLKMLCTGTEFDQMDFSAVMFVARNFYNMQTTWWKCSIIQFIKYQGLQLLYISVLLQ